MAKKRPNPSPKSNDEQRVSASVDELLTAALARGDESLETGRYIITYKEDVGNESVKSLKQQGLRIADARDCQCVVRGPGP